MKINEMLVARREVKFRKGERVQTSSRHTMTFLRRDETRKNMVHFIFTHPKFGEVKFKMNQFPFLVPVGLYIGRRDSVGQVDLRSNYNFLMRELKSVSRLAA